MILLFILQTLGERIKNFGQTFPNTSGVMDTVMNYCTQAPASTPRLINFIPQSVNRLFTIGSERVSCVFEFGVAFSILNSF